MTILSAAISNSSDIQLDIQKLIQSNQLHTIITIPSNSTIAPNKPLQCYLINDFSFSLQNKWENIMPLTSLIDLADSSVNFMMNTFLGNTSQMSLESIYMTASSWSGSVKPVFSLELLFFAFSPDVNPIDYMLMLAEGTLPTDTHGLSKLNNQYIDNAIDSLKSIATSVDTALSTAFNSNVNISTSLVNNISGNIGQMAPLKYGLNVRSNDNGYNYNPLPGSTFSIQIGQWFSAHQLLISSISPVRIFKENTIGGQPLAISMNVEFIPFQMITFKDFKNYFIMKSPKSRWASNSIVSKFTAQTTPSDMY